MRYWGIDMMVDTLARLVKPLVIPFIAIIIVMYFGSILLGVVMKMKTIRIIEGIDFLTINEVETGKEWKIAKILTIDDYNNYNSLKNPVFGKIANNDMMLHPLSDSYMIMSSKVGAYLLLSKAVKTVNTNKLILVKRIIEYHPLKRKEKLLDYEKESFIAALNKIGFKGSSLVEVG